VSEATFLSPCRVHSLEAYEALPVLGEADFFWRIEYLPQKRTFKPDRVPVFCTCELPYNPDLMMGQCDHCNDW